MDDIRLPDLTPKPRAALLAAYNAPGHCLRKTVGGHAAPGGEAFNRRVINWLDDAYLVVFDQPDFPKTVTLNSRGIALAKQLIAQTRAMEKAS